MVPCLCSDEETCCGPLIARGGGGASPSPEVVEVPPPPPQKWRGQGQGWKMASHQGVSRY